MATAVQGVQEPDLRRAAPPADPICEAPRTPEGVRLFGVRHLSAAGAWHLCRFLDETQPDAVLIEGPSDVSDLIRELCREGVEPPVAILCYTAEPPVHSIVYPFASYSPEYRAMLWAHRNGREARFIDLPSDVKSPLYRLRDELRTAEGAQGAEVLQKRVDFRRRQGALYDRVAALGGEADYDAYWERRFEHILAPDAYLLAVARHSAEMRALTERDERDADPLETSVNALRESFMKRRIAEAIAEGYAPEKIVAVVGAYHVTGLATCAPMTDDELASLPRAPTRSTLMPYSYYRLSTYSGYGAGNHAPAYYEAMYEAMAQDALTDLPARYLAEISGVYRDRHGYSSTASVIEALRLARSLQYLHDGLNPTLRDLHDAAVATMAGGDPVAIAEAFARIDVGTKIGALPENVSQTPIQDDLNRQLKALKLEKYKSVVATTLSLDLRENSRVADERAARLDLDRSIFLNRLRLLEIGFAAPVATKQEAASWAENWTLCWTPEVEIQAVESVLYGDTIEAAAAYKVRMLLEAGTDVEAVAAVVRRICASDLPASLGDAVRKLQALTVESENFSHTARAAREIGFLAQYGSVRRFDTGALTPILQQLFVKGALLLLPCASCDDDTARAMADDMTAMHYISQEHDEIVNDDLWLDALEKLARADDRNPLLCGFAYSIRMERGCVAEGDLATEVSRHLSAGNTPEAGAAWFEGLCRRNRYVLLSRTMLWHRLDVYLGELDDESFKRALVCLRRAFAAFDPREKSGVCDILAELWGVDAGGVAELLQGELTEADASALGDLDDFDFGDLI